MKKIILAISLFAGLQAQASFITMNPGDAPLTIGGTTIVCGGGQFRPPTEPERKFYCTCFAGNKNLGQVWGVWASGERAAEDIGMARCRQEHLNAWTTMVSCNLQQF